MKIISVAANSFHADGPTGGQADMMNLTVAFRNVANAPKSV